MGKLATGTLAVDTLIVPIPTWHNGLGALPGVQAVMNVIYGAGRSHDREVLPDAFITTGAHRTPGIHVPQR
ncbi:hypothetical protein [Deinococcus hopiensis]|uniref:hypothetical protein n=1 Tax=Deinococcus hopiensis TaxID=309885 RepID=UPI0009FF9647|nr:hypothetical protein [Deinococcus hopiensis]